MRISKWRKASMTVEMSLLIPLVLGVILSCIWGLFYYHDKNILMGAAYETAVVGSTKARIKESGSLEQLFHERVSGKCILFAAPSSRIAVTKEEVTVEVFASKGRMRIAVVQHASITEPEKFIRNIRRVK